MTPAARWSILSLALAAAGGLGALRSKENPGEPLLSEGPAKETSRSRTTSAWEASAREMEDRPVKPAPVWRGQASGARMAHGAEDTFSGAAGIAAPRQAGSDIAQGQDMLVSRDELEWRALKVEQEASKKLKNLL